MVYNEWEGITVGLTIGIFTPIIDGSFLDEKPSVSLKKKDFKKTNILMGANRDEGIFFILYYLADMFKKEEDVFINRQEFMRAITELNVYANPLQKFVILMINYSIIIIIVIITTKKCLSSQLSFALPDNLHTQNVLLGFRKVSIQQKLFN